MQTSPIIHFRGLRPSEFVTARVEKHLDRLGKFCSKMTRCEVVIERLSHRRHKGDIFHVRIALDLPGERVVVGREAGEDHAHADLYVALRDSFAAMRRRVQDYVRRQRLDIKAHEPELLEGRVTRLLKYEDFGFITTPDEREVYFDRNSVQDEAFDNLQLGAMVRFHPEMGDDGPQASTVYATRRRRGPAASAQP
jgi:cold shock CspA family protein